MSAQVPIPLWPDGPPGLDTADPPFVPTITPYPLAGAGPVGAVVVLPGGGYVGRAPHESGPVAEWLNRAGIAAFVCDYRVAPYRHPYPSLDAKRAVRWVRHHAPELDLLENLHAHVGEVVHHQGRGIRLRFDVGVAHFPPRRVRTSPSMILGTGRAPWRIWRMIVQSSVPWFSPLGPLAGRSSATRPIS